MFATKSNKNILTVCPVCGSKYSDSLKFCEKCGANLEKEKALKEQMTTFKNTTYEPLNSKYQGYIQVIAVMEVTVGVIALLIGFLLGVISPYITDLISTSSSGSNAGTVNSASVVRLMEMVFLTIGVSSIIFGVFAIYFGYKLYKLENVGRFGTLVVSSLLLIFIPFGTIFGIISLVLMSRPETIDLIRERNRYL